MKLAIRLCLSVSPLFALAGCGTEGAATTKPAAPIVAAAPGGASDTTKPPVLKTGPKNTVLKGGGLNSVQE